MLGRNSALPKVPVSAICTCGIDDCGARGRISPEVCTFVSRNRRSPTALLTLATIETPWLRNVSRFDSAWLVNDVPPPMLRPSLRVKLTRTDSRWAPPHRWSILPSAVVTFSRRGYVPSRLARSAMPSSGTAMPATGRANRTLSGVDCRWRSDATKKNVRSLTSGPPRLPPPACRTRPTGALPKASSAVSRWWRRK